jgi:hypothetical protein
MPTDEPNPGDIELARVLAERGLTRSPRTCLRWRRRGVLVPPESADEDDRPIYSAAAIERAVVYSQLLGEVGHERAVVSMWGNGADVPESTVLSALRQWQAERAERYAVEMARLTEPSVEREITKDVRRVAPAIANQLTEHAKRRQEQSTTVEVDYAFDGGGEPDDGFAPTWKSRPSIGSARGDVMRESLEAVTEGGEVTTATFYVYADSLGNPSDLIGIAEAVEREGGGVSIAETLKVIGACEEGRIPFARFVEWRNVLRSALINHFTEMARDMPSLASALDTMRDPQLAGPLVAAETLNAVTVEMRHAAVLGNEGAATA